jgi:hypothetical protein
MNGAALASLALWAWAMRTGRPSGLHPAFAELKAAEDTLCPGVRVGLYYASRSLRP